MPRSQLDHIVITAPSLEAGAEYVRDALGVEPHPGGEHARMGTHNRLLRLGERVYLEVIAVNPAASPPDRPRWFRLDEPDAVRAPRLATWVARADDIRVAAAASALPPGSIEPMSRGTLEWLITVRDDGGLPLGGLAPTLIQWPEGVHPCDTMKDSGCSLVRLEAFHSEPERVRDLLQSIRFAGELGLSPIPTGEMSRIVAHIRTPSGVRRLGAAS
jgi:glyoxalase-like protein